MIGVPNIDPCRAHTYMKLMKEGTRTQTTRSFYLCPLDLKSAQRSSHSRAHWSRVNSMKFHWSQIKPSYLQVCDPWPRRLCTFHEIHRRSSLTFLEHTAYSAVWGTRCHSLSSQPLYWTLSVGKRNHLKNNLILAYTGCWISPQQM